MFIEVTDRGDRTLVNVFEIKYMWENNDSEEKYTTGIAINTNEDPPITLKCKESYDDIKKIIMKKVKEMKGKKNRFELLDL